MHISEGVLSGQVLAAGAAVTAMGLGIGLRKMDNRRVPEVAVLTAAFFVASLVRVPAGPLPASIHLTMIGLMGLALGWAAFPAIFVGLALQALLFQFGGFTTLGVNTVIMALPAVCAYYLFGRLINSNAALAGFLSGAMGTAFAAVLMASALMATGESFNEIGGFIVGANVLAALIEGTVTAFIASFLVRVRPEFFNHTGGRT